MQRRMTRLTQSMISRGLVGREVWLGSSDTFAVIQDVDACPHRPMWVERFPGSGWFRPTLLSGIYLLDPPEEMKTFYGRTETTWSK